jgi:hypothetical protein
MREACLEEVYRLAKTDPRIVFIGSDLGEGTLKKFKQEMPGPVLYGRHLRAARGGHGGGNGGGRHDRVRQHDQHVHHPALLRADRRWTSACTTSTSG